MVLSHQTGVRIPVALPTLTQVVSAVVAECVAVQARVADVLRGLPQFKGRADSTLDDKAKDIVSALEAEGAIVQSQKPAKGRPATYRKADTGKASA